MKILVCPDAEQVAALAAAELTRQLSRKGRSVLGLATGRTMERIYALLVERHESGSLSFADCATFNLDEYVGLAGSDPRSYRAYMNQHLFDRVDIDKSRTHVPDGMAEDRSAEAAAYERAIRERGGIDLQLLGLGETGHIGFNEPLSAFLSRTRDVTLAQGTLRQNAGMFGDDEEAVPRHAMTMGIATILEARRILLVTTGAAKAEMLAASIEGPLTSRVTGSALQMHPDCIVLADEAAASSLADRAYYDHLARHDPELRAIADLGRSPTA